MRPGWEQELAPSWWGGMGWDGAAVVAGDMGAMKNMN